MEDNNNLNGTCQQTGVIYKITNLINGKIYVGQTKRSLKKRIREHCISKNTNGIEGAIKKYGIDNFKVEVIEECPVEMLNEREIFWIKELNSKAPNGYNLTDGGEGLKNPTKETCDRISANHADVSGKNNPNYGKHHSKKTRDKISASKQGEKNPNYGKHRVHSQATRDKIAIAHKGLQHSKFTRDKMSASQNLAWAKKKLETNQN